MDEQTVQMLMQYLAAAKKGNKNVSSVMNNLDSPILLGMAGVLDPYYGMGAGGGTTYGSFASDETTPPAVRAIMDYVDQGMNPYQIEAQVNALDDEVIRNSGYTDEQLISMGREMAKEGGKKGTDVFAKAGLRNPNDVYDLETVPLDVSELENVRKYTERAMKTEKGLGQADYELGVAQRRLKESRGKPSKGYAYEKKQAMPSQEDRDAVSRAQANKYNIESAARGDLMRAQAVREGALKRAAQSGRTPFTDQTSTLLKFIAGSK